MDLARIGKNLWISATTQDVMDLCGLFCLNVLHRVRLGAVGQIFDSNSTMIAGEKTMISANLLRQQPSRPPFVGQWQTNCFVQSKNMHSLSCPNTIGLLLALGDIFHDTVALLDEWLNRHQDE